MQSLRGPHIVCGVTFYQKERRVPVRHTTMLEINEFLVLDYVRENDPTTRTDIAAGLGLSAPSISRIIARLLADGLVVDAGTLRSVGGRPRALISFRRDAGAVIAVDVGGTRCHAVLADLSGTVLADDTRPTQSAGGSFATLLTSVEAMRDAAARRDIPVVALAVGVPGTLNPDSGVVTAAPYVGWDGYPLAEQLDLATDLPFVIDNDVNLAALAHAWRGDGRLVDHFVTFSIGTGTGAAIISGGRLLQGRNNAAGEVAYLVVRPEQLGRQVVDSLGAFESIVSGPGIAASAAARLASGGMSVLGEAAITPETVFAAAAAGDEVGQAVVASVLDDLAMALVAVICVVDPELVILEGGVGRELGAYLDQLHARIAPSVPSPPRIAISGLGRDATVIGATAAALELARSRAAPAAVSGAFSRSGVGRLPHDPGAQRRS